MFGLWAAVGTPALSQTTGGTVNPGSKPSDPTSPQPLQPLAPVPARPSPAAPRHVPAPTYPQGPSAEQDSVLLRPRPEFEPAGLELDLILSSVGLVDRPAGKGRQSPLASFVVFPRLDFDTVFDSNLFRSKEETSDKIFIVSPSLTVRSDWARHSLELAGSANVARYARTATENYEDYLGRVSGTLDIYDNFKISGAAQYAQRHQQRGEIIDPGDTSGATVIDEGKVKAGAEFTRAALTLSGNAESVFSDFVSTSLIDQDDLDQTEHTLTARASLEVDPGTSIFVQPKYVRRDYDRDVDSAGFRQDSAGIEILTGVRWDASGVTFVELGLGYFRHEFDEARFSTIQGPTGSAKIVWNFTDLWTLTLDVSRTVTETADVDFSGVLNTRFKSRLDYEFLYNTVFSLKYEYADEDYDGSTRSDERSLAGFRVKHLFNEFLFAEIDIKHERLNSSRDTDDFKATGGFVRVGSQI
ncbi:MAG: outer membrane beta-barrel protein [Rhodospirillaceae bacterium]|nr:outer membrane beta-barrel protein [Rhodospirillaceae bacterium]